MLNVLVQAALALQLGAPPAVAAHACARPAVNLFAGGVRILKAVRVFTGPDGESHSEDISMTGESHTMAGVSLEQTVLGASSKISMVSGPGGLVLPPHTAVRSLYLELAGSSFVSVPGGEERELTPGALAIFDDAGLKIGHGGRSGPCGYIAIAIAPPSAPTTR